MRFSIHTLTTRTVGIISIAVGLVLAAPAVHAAPGPGACPTDVNSCAFDSTQPTAPADMTAQQQSVYCYGIELANRQNGTAYALPLWCKKLMETAVR